MTPAAQTNAHTPVRATKEIHPWTLGTWTHPPVSTRALADESLEVEAFEGSDAWRHTGYQFVHDSEHALLAPLRPGEAMEIDFTLDFDQTFDQAGLFIKRSRDRWIKAGVEIAEGAPHVGAVATDGMSDWSAAEVSSWAGQMVTIRASWIDDAIVVRARAGGDPFRLVRISPFVREGQVAAGPYCCAPTRSGLSVRFSQWRIGQADARLH